MNLKAPQFHRLYNRSGDRFSVFVDGREVEVQAGDLVITAVLLHQGAVRRFEFSDGYRAGYCLMSACQDCWVRLGDGRRVRSCDTLVEAGLTIETGILDRGDLCAI